MKNKAMRMAMIAHDLTQKKLAEEMGINARVFQNKINHTKVNGYTAQFTASEKLTISARLGLMPADIE